MMTILLLIVIDRLVWQKHVAPKDSADGAVCGELLLRARAHLETTIGNPEQLWDEKKIVPSEFQPTVFRK